MSADPSSISEPGSPPAYAPALWERILGYVAAFFIIGLVAYVIIQGKPLQDQNFAVFLRILLSGAMAIIGAVIPGFLSVDLSGRGVAIRAGGALALFVVTFFFSPKVLPQISGDVQYPWAKKMVELNGDFERLTRPLLASQTEEAHTQARVLRADELRKLQEAHSHAFKFIYAQKLAELPSPKQLIRLRYYEGMAHYQVAALASMRSEYNPSIGRDELIQDAQQEAEMCIKAAEDGLRWCQNVLTYPAIEERPFPDAPRKWASDAYRAVQSWVQEGIDKDLMWYRTAGHAILAYYGKYDGIQARTEINELAKAYPPWSKDPPREDEIMGRILDGRLFAQDISLRLGNSHAAGIPVRQKQTQETVGFSKGEQIRGGDSAIVVDPVLHQSWSKPVRGPCCR
jgi:hypothetical protein